MKPFPLVLLLAITSAQARAAEIYQDFRRDDVDTQLFRLHGPEAAQRIKREPQGLRITLPADEKSATVGLNTRIPVTGDFEVTVGYEILQAERPAKGSGVGLEIYINTETLTDEALAFYRIARPKEGDIYMCDKKTTNAGKRETVRNTFPTTTRSGHLRVARKGTEVTFWAADAAADDFQELCRYEWGAMDLKGVGVRAWGSHNVVDLRITDVRIRDQGEPVPAAAVDNAPAPRPSWRPWLLAGLGGGTLLLGGLLWSWRRRRRPGSIENVQPAGSVSFFCSACGNRLKTSAASAGKTVKCPGCGQPAPVPAASTGIRASGRS